MGGRSGEVEDMVIDSNFWAGRRVLLTGHTGFKGAWTALLLASRGAEVYGFALPAADPNGIFEVARLREDVRHQEGDIRDSAAVRAVVAEAQPHIVLHMAAQALVRSSYDDPIGTYATNVMGTANLLDALRGVEPLEAVVIVTSDKCYDNVGSIWGYRETDHLGGHDPYSNSKACAELVADAYRRSFFHTPGSAAIATGRAGNVIGGGDFSVDRLLPDAVRAFSRGTPLKIRNPEAIRPWQHVLDPVLGYLRLAERLSQSGKRFAEAWNFGPASASEVPVRRIIDDVVALWGGAATWEHDIGEHVHEATLLKLDCSKAAARLGWRGLIGIEDSLRLTVDWYRAAHEGADMRAFSLAQISAVLDRGSRPAL